MATGTRLGFGLFVALSLATPATAGAAPCPSVASDTPVDAADVARRLTHIDQVLRDETRKAALWNRAWGGIFGLLAVAQGTVAIVSDEAETRRAFGANSVRTAVATANQIVAPLRIPDLESTEPTCEALAAAEAALVLASRNERKQLALFVPRVGSLALNLGVGVFLLAYGQTVDALIATASGLLVSEIRFQTAPFGAVRAHDRYMAGDLSAVGASSKSGPEWLLVPSVAGIPSGATFVLRF